ncbi:hypothetical protein G6F57_014291 [Rhizopus arrhizus]|uniref:Tc1-like transposase DDE domain-containing protein n=1 Tax=Rhizopus oryzae TaxID=64495 RepID=A0A9P6X030_RHIOR|nr:hypothetical protein G6F23_011609 [Rhizopus arrhizus]KAG1393982.1 hypothetical protein G6F58_012204 [Rhizopus delemar]KAG0756533.1 hypothetical protein G6F24_011086 [Rhizopus arrhizus]KAG0777051.1 hypothetical protein G6F22_012140 [Rhizopus arrhizus]KAG0782701.1 hypothetical protein G6F21_010966 [Rhizopus arrhizus]
MLENPQERKLVAKVARDLNINYRTALRWWKYYEWTEEVAYKKFEENSGPKSSFTTEHNEYIKELLDNDLQLYSDDIINSLTERFEDFTISKSQLNNHLRNTVLITVKKLMFEPESATHTIIGAIHSSSIVHVVIRKFPPRKETQAAKKKRNVNNGKKRTAIVICTVDPEVDDDPADNKPTPKGATTAHFIKFMNELLDVMDLDETFKGSYIVMDNASIHKSKPMLQKIESKGYKVMYLPPYSPELNPIEQFWAIVKGEMKRDRLMSEENLSSRIGDACNAVLISDLYSFCSHSKRQIIKCYNKTPF